MIDYSYLEQLEKNNSKIVLITGGSSGIGYEAVINMINEGHFVILPCRDSQRSEEVFKSLVRDIKSETKVKNSVELPLMDLSDLKSIDNCCSDINRKYKLIDILILNAGLQYSGSKVPKWSKQGIELTFAVNHLSHYYLTSRIMPLLSKSKFPRVIITASEVHNPETAGGRIGAKACLGSLLGLKLDNRFLMLDGEKIFNADKAYKDSKLCNVIFAKELYRRLRQSSVEIPVIAWAPGLVIPRTDNGFFRYSRKYNELGQRIFAFFARDIFRISETPFNAGKLLVDLAMSDRYKAKVFSYVSNKLLSPGKFRFEDEDISLEANSDYLGSQLWDLSDKIISDKMYPNN